MGDVRCIENVVLKTGLSFGVGAQESLQFGNAEMTPSVVFRVRHTSFEQRLVRRLEIATTERGLVKPGGPRLREEPLRILTVPLPGTRVGDAASGDAHGVKVGTAEEEVGYEHGAVVERHIRVESLKEREEMVKV